PRIVPGVGAGRPGRPARRRARELVAGRDNRHPRGRRAGGPRCRRLLLAMGGVVGGLLLDLADRLPGRRRPPPLAVGPAAAPPRRARRPGGGARGRRPRGQNTRRPGAPAHFSSPQPPAEKRPQDPPRHYHHNVPDVYSPLTIPEILNITERVSHDLWEMVDQR